MSLKDVRRELFKEQGDRTEQEFSSHIGISRPTLNRLKNERRGIGVSTLRLIFLTYPHLINVWLTPAEKLTPAPQNQLNMFGAK